MEKLVIDIKQGKFHKLDCRLIKPAMVFNQNEHDFRIVKVNKVKDLLKKTYIPCAECIKETF